VDNKEFKQNMFQEKCTGYKVMYDIKQIKF